MSRETEVTYFHRNRRAGISIAKVSATLITEISKVRAVKEFQVPTERALLTNISQNVSYIIRHRNKQGINHITGDIHYGVLGLIGCKSVLTIHDLCTIDCAVNPLRRGLMKLLWFKLPLLIASKVVCISAHTRDKLSAVTKRKDIEVIYNPLDPSFIAHPKIFNDNCPVILHIGTGWNKNLTNLINAVSGITCHLVIIGNVNADVKKLLDNKKILHTVKVGLSDEELLNEYKKCDIVSFCSIYEGFGMPIIEANAIGRPVITSNIAPMTEVAGKAACFVDPHSVSSITAGIKHIITNRSYRIDLIKNGLENIDRFNVKKIASAYLDLYANL